MNLYYSMLENSLQLKFIIEKKYFSRIVLHELIIL